ncbi:MAG TPA: M20/M25/M40 family metallo-hydrolase [Bryobacteraceae bacterium]|nr:M20/M25/M40 family metallo-hydrolase [Bryobacteraceae bacterium]
MASSPLKTFPAFGRANAQTRRISRLSESSPLGQAQRWFAREKGWINEQHLQLCRIAAPTFFEQPRAEWFRSQLAALGWNARLDRAGNVLAQFASQNDGDFSLIVSAHLDTVFAPARMEDIYFGPDGRLFGPGVSDNGAGLTALLALARVLNESDALHGLAAQVLLVANVGEEGEGNLSGMRYLCRQGTDLSQIKAFLVLDGPSIDHITAQALASRRYEVSFTGPGGHSWNDSGISNPVHAISIAISTFVHNAEGVCANQRSRCSYNFGVLEGGASINSIPSSARAKLDLRSEEPNLLDELSGMLSAAVESALEHENRAVRGSRLSAKIKELGSRPGGKLHDHSPLLQTIQAVDSYLNVRSRVDCASTDANVPLSLGLPAISLGAGGQGGGAHTQQEWYQPEGRELGLRRILLTLAALAEQDTFGVNGE